MSVAALPEDLISRIAAQLPGRQDRTLRYLQLAIAHKLVPSPERWFGKSDPGFTPLLPAGMHTLTAAEFHETTVRAFQGSATRARLWDSVQRFHANLSRLQVASELWLAGSFLSSKADPSDVDVVVVLLTERIFILKPKQALELEQLLAGAKGSSLDLAMMFEGDLALRAYLQGYLGFCEDRVRPMGIAVLPVTTP